jgi:hypothetical protein
MLAVVVALVAQEEVAILVQVKFVLQLAQGQIKAVLV